MFRRTSTKTEKRFSRALGLLVVFLLFTGMIAPVSSQSSNSDTSPEVKSAPAQDSPEAVSEEPVAAQPEAAPEKPADSETDAAPEEVAHETAPPADAPPAEEPAEEPAPAEPAGPVISEVVVIGNQNINRDPILDTVSLKPGTPFRREQMLRDRAAIEAMGFFDNVAAREEETPAGLRVTFEVVENPVVKTIQFSGNTVLSAEQLKEAMRTKEGQVFNNNTFLDQDLAAIEDAYRRLGYLAIVTADADLDSDTGMLSLPILEFRVNRIRFTGLSKTKPIVFRRVMNLKEGELFNDQTLQKDLARIYELDILDVEKAEFPVREPSSEPGYVDITIPVHEKKTGNINVGLGYSSLQKVVGRVEIYETNFRGLGQGVNALYEVSGAGRGGSYELGYFDPFFREDQTSINVRYYNKAIYRFSSSALGGGSILDDSYDERRAGAVVGFSRPFGDTLRGFITLRTESIKTNYDESRPINSDLPIIIQNGRINSVAFKANWDTRDFRLDPAMGQLVSFTYEPGYSKMSGLDGNMFTKLEMDLRKYISPEGPRLLMNDKRRTFAFRLQGGWSIGSLPFYEQFFLGGAERLRGYREDRFWGSKFLLCSTEYRTPIAGGLNGVLFVDYGSAWGDDYRGVSERLTQSRSFDGHLGYGAGIRVSTPIGNLRFDYGFGEEGNRTHFSIGQAF